MELVLVRNFNAAIAKIGDSVRLGKLTKSLLRAEYSQVQRPTLTPRIRHSPSLFLTISLCIDLQQQWPRYE